MAHLQRLFFKPNQFQQHQVILTPEQTRYLTKVLRLVAGDRFIAMDGQGHWWQACLAPSLHEATLMECLNVNHELPIPLTLIAAPSKGNGFESVIHSATELGVHHIYPLLSDRTIVQPNENKITRWQKIAIEAAEQSLRQKIPIVHAPIRFQELAKLQPTSPNEVAIFCSTNPLIPMLQQHLQHQKPNHQPHSATVLTGPEGGWTPSEEEQMKDWGFHPVSLGKRILRAVTAPICALSLITANLEAQAND